MTVTRCLALALLTSVALPSTRALPAGGLSVESLRCEYLSNPLGIDAARPRLSWTLRSDRRAQLQTAYQVLVASTPERLRAGEADLWDSGRVPSDRTCHIVYSGRPLASRQRCHWTVRVWDGPGEPSAWAGPASWEMGLLAAEDWKGRWIARTLEKGQAPAPHFRRELEVKGKVRRARISACGLGYQDLWLNGTRVGDHFLDPGYTRYDKRCLYVTHDVTGLLREGRNAIGAVLGTGWYDVHTLAVWYFDKAPWRASPRLILDLWIEYEDGRTETFGTDAGWKTSTGPIVFDSIYGGESYDARLEIPGWAEPGYDDSAWRPALEVEGPGGRLAAQAMPPMRITRDVAPVRVTEPAPGVFVFDLGQNLAGVARLSVSGAAGTKVTLRYGERLRADGRLDPSNIAQHMVKTDPPQRFQTDEYILKGSGSETWEARFAYHGFQYVEVTGFPGKLGPDSLRGRFCHTDVPPAGRFECSNPLLNRIHEATRWSFLSNFQGIPTDCPHREKNGWTGDAHLAAEQAMYGFDPPAAYEKWIADLDDEQRKADEGKRHRGELPGIVPTSGWGYDWGNGPAWDSAFLLIPWYLHEHYGDTRVLEAHYEGFKLYVDYLTRRSRDGIVSIGLGDWCPAKTETPVEVTSTGYYYKDAVILSRAAALLGRAEDATKYAGLARGIRDAFQRKFIDREKGSCANGSQTALGCALYQELVDPADAPKVVARLVEAVEKNGGLLDFGILGSKYVLNALTDGGRADVAYGMVAEKRFPSWGHWIEQGATTLWESWGGGDSRNHIMFGEVTAWMYRALAGIARDPAAPGFRRFIVKPHPVGDLAWVRAEYDSIRGRIASEWRRDADAFRLRVAIPAGTEARVLLPAGPGATVTEGGKPVAEAIGVRATERTGDRLAVEVGSGEYAFEVRE